MLDRAGVSVREANRNITTHILAAAFYQGFFIFYSVGSRLCGSSSPLFKGYSCDVRELIIKRSIYFRLSVC